MVNYLEHRPMEPFQNYWIVIATPCGFSGFIASGSSSIVTLRSVSAATFASKTDPSGNDTFAPLMSAPPRILTTATTATAPPSLCLFRSAVYSSGISTPLTAFTLSTVNSSFPARPNIPDLVTRVTFANTFAPAGTTTTPLTIKFSANFKGTISPLRALLDVSSLVKITDKTVSFGIYAWSLGILEMTGLPPSKDGLNGSHVPVL